MDHYTASTAKPKLGRILDRILKTGVPVVIRRGNRFVQLTEYAVPEPVTPGRPVATAAEEPAADYGRTGRLHFSVSLFESDEGWAVSCAELPGCHSQGKTRGDALKNIREAIRLWLEVEAEETGLKRVEKTDVRV